MKKAWYGTRTAGARFHEDLSEKCRRIGFKPSMADPDLYMREQDDHWEYIARYVDDILVISKDPVSIIKEIQKDFWIKEKSIAKPEYFLGGNIHFLAEEYPTWKKKDISIGLSAKTYIENIIQKVERIIGKPVRVYKTPMTDTYHPEMDETPLLLPEDVSIYRMLVGAANWCITLGRHDVHYAVCTMARYSNKARVGHRDAMVRIFGYLKGTAKARTLIDNSQIDLCKLGVKFEDVPLDKWQEFYPEADEEIPHNMPTPKGKPVQTTVFVDASHASDLDTRRSVTGVFAFCNSTLIKGYCKRQTTVEQSTYGSEINAGRAGVDMVCALRHDLRAMGIPLISGPTTLVSDNMSVVLNCNMPSSTLKKKHVACGYHRMREAVASGIIRLGHIPTESNFADLLTKPLDTARFRRLTRPLFFRGLQFKSEGESTVCDVPSIDDFSANDKDTLWDDCHISRS